MCILVLLTSYCYNFIGYITNIDIYKMSKYITFAKIKNMIDEKEQINYKLLSSIELINVLQNKINEQEKINYKLMSSIELINVLQNKIELLEKKVFRKSPKEYKNLIN